MNIDLLPFFLGIPLAVPVERLAERLTCITDIPDSAIGRKLLFWQVDPLASRLRFALSACTPVIVGLAALRFDPLGAVVVSLVLLALLLCTTTDLLCYRVPDAVTYPAFALAILAAALLPSGELADAILGALAAGALFLPMYHLTGGRIDLGDAKVAILVGGILGLGPGFDAIVLGTSLAAATLSALLLAQSIERRQVTPYAPFLAVSAIVVTFLQGTAFAPL